MIKSAPVLRTSITSFDLDCQQSLSGQSRGRAKKPSAKKLERTSGGGLGERREKGERKRFPSSLFSFISLRSSLAAL